MSTVDDQATAANAGRCPNCGVDAAAGSQFCGECGAALPRTCPHCGAPLSSGARFCGECGATTAADASPRLAAWGAEAAPPSQARKPRRKAAAAQQPARLTQAASAPTVPRAAAGRRASGRQKTAAASLAAGGRPGNLRTLFLMMTNPGQIVAQRMSTVSWPFALLVSGAAFGLFFLQTGLDVARDSGRLLLVAGGLGLTGALFGTAGMALLGFVAWLLSRLFGGGGKPAGWAVRALALSYSSALVYAAIGLLFNLLLGWNTSLAFGVTGVLWALGPMTAVFKELSGGRLGPSMVLATVCGALVLLAWSGITL